VGGSLHGRGRGKKGISRILQEKTKVVTFFTLMLTLHWNLCPTYDSLNKRVLLQLGQGHELLHGERPGVVQV
jgi:hypothetical protein